ncbi:1,2-oxophytodienoate reductase [Frondihabitans sp. PAMC 28766]|uniref:alkene reductase n=1 Tax=Frondihabitans sp. PAMC 28766 TaxID=1795630 RepID=UPI00078DA7ED|nr:alkene reductase [Frondihabitans sp. PAMC 28766]AMM18891.1 1,2-oxophytodienoate reductase [Frondihabitans sp. PAMC 28766]
MTSIWDPIIVGRMALTHRLALSPMTRNRAGADGTPLPIVADYYAQRASLGLLITEGTQPSADGQGYLTTPGIYTDEHVAGWRTVTDAVHAAGGHVFIQLMHAGRMSHPDNTPHHRQPVAPSAIAPDMDMTAPTGKQPAPVPRALTTDEVHATVADFRHAAAQAIAAGADGVEIHAANGYLLQQFLSSNSNTRTDEYGGSLENRIRLTLEVAEAVVAEIGADRVGIRISPANHLGGIDEGSESVELYRILVSRLAPLGLAYLNVFDFTRDEAFLASLRDEWPTALLLIRAGRTLDELGRDVESGLADIAPIGMAALANPDIVERLREGASLNTPDVSTFYTGGARGFTDYPTLDS